MIRKTTTADDIELRLKRLNARKVADEEFSTAREYSGIYRFVVETFEKKSKSGHNRMVAGAGSLAPKKVRV